MVVLRDSGALESDEPIEESFFEELYSSPPTTYSPPRGPTNFPYFPPSPTYLGVGGPTSFPPSPPSFPLYSPASPPPPSSSASRPMRVWTAFDIFHGFQNQQHEYVVDLPVLVVEYLIEKRGGELNVINGLEGGALNVINQLEMHALEDSYDWLSLNEINYLEHQHEDIVDQLVIDFAEVDHSVIGYRGDKLDLFSVAAVLTINGVEYRKRQALSTTPESSVVFVEKLSVRVWLGSRGQLVADIRYGWNWLNLGTFKTAEGAPSTAESFKRWRGGKDLFDYPQPFLIENRSQPLQLPPTAQEENQDGGIGCEGIGDCAMADQAQFNSECSKTRKTREKNPGGETSNKKAKGVRIEIPSDDILQRKGMCIKNAANDLKVSKSTLKRICREYGIKRWPPRKEQELISQSRPNKSPAVVDQEQIPQLNPDTLLPPNQVPANSDTYRVKVKCEEGTIIKFRLSSPWRKVELEQEVKKRLPFEAGTYDIKYKDEDDDLILLSCDEDLAECISSSSPVGSRSIELFLKLK
ncbi:uncharacterized protein LOC131306237 [Rhododendron vialii]|uniref:uncharacterized protein LOC131306237 n=1 Tax=Rhododendron vialii TaxID=182163 RepID=UPI00265ED9E0|nr:uncharacterized protein LOC131306237 [Rhododendron vialii]